MYSESLNKKQVCQAQSQQVLSISWAWLSGKAEC